MKDKNELRTLPIGVMDSGLGGLSVLKEAIRILPEEDFVYYGDSANAPYGTKSTEEIRRLTFNVVDSLIKEGIKALVVACNTATGAAINELRDAYPELPILGIEPAIKPAVICNQGGRIIVMATPMTIKQEKFNELLEIYSDEAEIVPLGCEGLMEFVEYGNFDQKIINGYLQDKLEPVLTENTESIVLGCTHYPFLKRQIKEFLGDRNILLIDGAKGTSSNLKRRLYDADLLRNDGNVGAIKIMNSSDSAEIIEYSRKLLNQDID